MYIKSGLESNILKNVSYKETNLEIRFINNYRLFEVGSERCYHLHRNLLVLQVTNVSCPANHGIHRVGAGGIAAVVVQRHSNQLIRPQLTQNVGSHRSDGGSDGLVSLNLATDLKCAQDF